MESKYAHDFYSHRHRQTRHAARTVLSIVLELLPPVRSAIDLGCGVGTWLAALREFGTTDVRGLDGPWVDPALLQIPQQDFQVADFEKPIVHRQRYDLAISLEVAEHIPESGAGRFVDALVGASDFVLFSAAIPFQGGVGHVNEQWPDYWAAMFADRGHVALDIVRSKIWDDESIPFWYRQNILLFASRDKVSRLAPTVGHVATHTFPIALVHPELYLARSIPD
ncbi:MAG: methyltransferase domain-containing protein [Zoogloeaceae bacterium]|nr:methyltransferase domain-containing protein [Rhodocyclaceae bacterium]MCP5237346.1 methyltransferase domain-containing protein [Zoogloeaceae bacterium]